MATYNGERYVKEQLESIAAQTHQPYELVVCDDGSSDATLSVVADFSRSVKFPVRAYSNERNLGYSDNFLKAAKICGGDWVAFCDQDDVWLPNKLKSAADAIERVPELTMVLQNAELCDSRLNRRGRVFPNKIRRGVYGANSQYGFWVWPGFLKTVRSDLFVKLDTTKRPKNYFPDQVYQSHDKWTCMIANALGGIAVLGEPVALYRRHEAALTGSYTGKSIRERVKGSRSVGANHYRFLSEVARSCRAYLVQVAGEVSDDGWRRSLQRSAEWYEHLADIQDYRAALYSAQGVLPAITQYCRIWRSGGYLGPRFTAMGAMSGVKDAGRVFFGSRITALKAS
jgi:glycosyltransferase involved in cell wall biosynthesis